MKLAIAFTNFGPYHIARLRALGRSLRQRDGRLIAHEIAGDEAKYPWRSEQRSSEPFAWRTLFPERRLEDLTASECRSAMRQALNADDPDAVLIVGYTRPECLEALDWARKRKRPAILLSETQEIDHPRVWWKEWIKRLRVRRFDAAVAGGPRHRDYLVKLGMSADRIALGYDAVDNEAFAGWSAQARADDSPAGRSGIPEHPYFLTVARFAPEKNLVRLIHAFARYRRQDPQGWDLVLCGGGPDADLIENAIRETGLENAIHRPGFLQARDVARYYAFASAFVLPSVSEPWGLVLNEAAACGLPLLASERVGAAPTLVINDRTGRTFDPLDEIGMADSLGWIAGLDSGARSAMGQAARDIVADWGPDRFARASIEMAELAQRAIGGGQRSMVSGREDAQGEKSSRLGRSSEGASRTANLILTTDN